jgi:hypothetical protein
MPNPRIMLPRVHRPILNFRRLGGPARKVSRTQGIEYKAAIAEEDYDAFKMLVSTPLPREYDMSTCGRLRTFSS